jgi:hypothetical protein
MAEAKDERMKRGSGLHLRGLHLSKAMAAAECRNVNGSAQDNSRFKVKSENL